MKNLLFALISVAVVSGAAFAQTGDAHPHAGTRPAAKSATKTAVKPAPAKAVVTAKTEALPAKAVCPITKEEFKPTASSDKSTYNGKTYYFCCGGCKPQFDKNPAKYVTAAKPAPAAAKKPAAKPAPVKKNS